MWRWTFLFFFWNWLYSVKYLSLNLRENGGKRRLPCHQKSTRDNKPAHLSGIECRQKETCTKASLPWESKKTESDWNKQRKSTKNIFLEISSTLMFAINPTAIFQSLKLKQIERMVFLIYLKTFSLFSPLKVPHKTLFNKKTKPVDFFQL